MTEANDDKRPDWPFDQPEVLIRWFRRSRIISMKPGWRMTGEDSRENWVEMVSHDGKTQKIKPVWYGQPSIWTYIEFDQSAGQSLVKWTSKGRQALETIALIDAFDERCVEEKAEYERLKAKFGDG